MNIRAKCPDCGWNRLYRRPDAARRAANQHECDSRTLDTTAAVDAGDVTDDRANSAGVVEIGVRWRPATVDPHVQLVDELHMVDALVAERFPRRASTRRSPQLVEVADEAVAARHRAELGAALAEFDRYPTGIARSRHVQQAVGPVPRLTVVGGERS